ncbi:unnamed protein product [Merluccius merluccius]
MTALPSASELCRQKRKDNVSAGKAEVVQQGPYIRGPYPGGAPWETASTADSGALPIAPSPRSHPDTVHPHIQKTSLGRMLRKEAFERPKLRYTELTAVAEEWGWRAKICSVDVGCQGFVATSTVRLLRDLEISRQAYARPSRKHQRWQSGGASDSG